MRQERTELHSLLLKPPAWHVGFFAVWAFGLAGFQMGPPSVWVALFVGASEELSPQTPPAKVNQSAAGESLGWAQPNTRGCIAGVGCVQL